MQNLNSALISWPNKCPYVTHPQSDTTYKTLCIEAPVICLCSDRVWFSLVGGAAMEDAGKKVVKRSAMGRSRKGCMKGKGGPENALCSYRGCHGLRHGAQKLYGPSAKLNLPHDSSPLSTTPTATTSAVPSNFDGVGGRTETSNSVKTTTSNWVCGVQEVKYDHEENFWESSSMFDEIQTENWVQFPIEGDPFGIDNLGTGVDGEEVMDWDGVQVTWSL
ncbi:hypothetical protein CK203_098167 [Vitis vinifera]|uniref:Uncharacterized protein n=1 Tax=Vitis vinifera TaxID=29760 RepID=A0A438C0S4_VITVI|nr:hypothetical protein CK203_098167 [Vitis vinifera]